MSPYVLLDDGFHSNPKVLKAGFDGAGLYARALSFCGAYLTDGHISAPAMASLSAGKQGARALALCLVAGLIVPDGDDYLIPDYLEINDSREVILERRKQKSEAGKKGAAAKHLPKQKSGTRQEPAKAGAKAPATADAEQEPTSRSSETVARAREAFSPSPYLLKDSAEQTEVQAAEAALPKDETLEQLGARLEAAANNDTNGRAPYGSVDSVYEVIDKPAGNTRRELEKWLPMLPPQLVEHVREQVLACEPRKSKAAYAVGTAQRLARERGAA